MFKKYDCDGSGTITENEVRGLLIETHKSMNLDYQPQQTDINLWMEMTDTNKDGLITLQEFQALVIKSL